MQDVSEPLIDFCDFPEGGRSINHLVYSLDTISVGLLRYTGLLRSLETIVLLFCGCSMSDF